MEKINKLKKIFEREKIDGYIIPKNDEFFGEYTPDSVSYTHLTLPTIAEV